MITAAVVGVGSMGRNHARVYRTLPGVRLVAVADSDPEAAGRVGQFYEVPFYVDLRAMLAQARPDAVSVAVPTASHFAVARECLLAGCHVLVEKPIAATTAQGLDLVDLAGRVERVLMVGHVERFNPAVIEMARRLDRGQLGSILYMLGRRLGPPPLKRPPGGVVLDLACHDIDVMLLLCDAEVEDVSSKTRSIRRGKKGADSQDLAIAVLQFSNGVLGILEASWVTPTKVRELWVTGDKGMFVLDYLAQDLCYYPGSPSVDADRPGAWNVLDIPRGGAENCMVRYGIRRAEPLFVELSSFVGAISRQDYGLGTACAAVRALEIAELLAARATNPCSLTT